VRARVADVERELTMTTRTTLLAMLFVAVGCGSSGGDPAVTGDAMRNDTDPRLEAGGRDAATTDASATKDGPADGWTFDPGFPVPPMPLISEGVPAFASSGSASDANDTNPASAWGTESSAAWIAYDLSAVPVAKRQRALVAWYAIHSGCYIDETSTGGQRPLAYTIETNAAAGGAKSAPATGWTPVLTIADNRYCGRHHLVELGGASWIRLNVSKSTPDGVALDLAVYSAPDGATDSWLFMGDSITSMTMTYAFSDLPAQVRALSPGHVPAVLDAALGGTNTGTAIEVIDDTMRDFPGRFVVLAYGTNDHASEFHMKELVDHVLAAGKTPVVPHMPWASDSPEGEEINALIDALYVAQPKIVRGPDLWKGLEGHPEWIPIGDVHPTSEGMTEIRRLWAKAMAATYRP
jgi:hypothetical protein